MEIVDMKNTRALLDSKMEYEQESVLEIRPINTNSNFENMELYTKLNIHPLGNNLNIFF